MTMTDDHFAKLVAEEVKNKVSADSRAELLEQHNWERWERALIALVNNLDNQIADINSDIESDTERYERIEGGQELLSQALSVYDNRQKKIERFKFHVENRLAQVSKMIATGIPIEDDSRKTVALLRRAIKQHKQMMEQFDLEPTPVDVALWSSLDGKWGFDNIDMKDVV